MKTVIAIGGGEIKNKTTLGIDKYIAELAKKRAGERRAVGLFVGTASHDSMPYFNSFRKTYTSVFDVKADCALTVYGEMSKEKIRDKFLSADFVYIGGGDTLFMLDHWKKTGTDELVLDAYNRGVIICGLSAGAIFWFDKMYTDSKMVVTQDEYSLQDGLGVIGGLCTPHFNEREKDFSEAFIKSDFRTAFAIENDSALVFGDGKLLGAVNYGGKAYILKKEEEKIQKFVVSPIGG